MGYSAQLVPMEFLILKRFARGLLSPNGEVLHSLDY